MSTRSTLLLAITVACTILAPTVARSQAARPSMGGGSCDANPLNCPDAANPLPARGTVWLEEMTWMEVRDALRNGRTTIIIPTGGIEPNGPWLATGKHNYILQVNCDAIARELGNALCAPILKFVPEGRIDPPSGHMTSPGTISLREPTYRAVLADVVASLRAHGFRNIILIGDSGGNQGGQRAVADSLTALWKGTPVVAHVQEYYDYAAVQRYLESEGVTATANDGLHDDPMISLNMLVADPASLRYDERVRAGLATINGVSLADRERALALGRKVVAYRARQTAEAIRRSIAHGGTLPGAR